MSVVEVVVVVGAEAATVAIAAVVSTVEEGGAGASATTTKRLRPRSDTESWQSVLMRMFCGLRSRWRTPAE